MEKAFGGPLELKKRLGGHLDVREIAAMDPDKLVAVFRERPALHRFPGSMAKRTQALCQVIVAEYGGDAGSVWRDARDGDDLAARIKKLPGFGDMKGTIMVAVLAKKFGVKPTGWEKTAANWLTVADVDRGESRARGGCSKNDRQA